MSVDPSKLRAGSIVWAIVRDHNGFRKRRPAIVLMPDAEIATGGPIVVMAITTTYPQPAPTNCIELPWNNDARKVSTHLARRSAAVVDWLDTIYLDEIDGLIGSVPALRMKEIFTRLRDIDEQ